MLQITPHQKLHLAVAPADFRKGIDSLAALCQAQLASDPFSGTLFIFRNRRGTALKILVYDGQGFWLCLKRFSKGRVAWWPTDPLPAYRITASQLHVLLYQGHPLHAEIPEDWRKI